MADDSYYAQGLIAVHDAILADNVQDLADACQSTDLDEIFTPEINQQHAGMTPLALACALNKPHLVRVLLQSGSDPNAVFASLNTTALMTSAFHGHAEIVQLLLEAGSNVRAVDLQESTALGYCFGGTRNLDIVHMLLKAGVDVNQKNVLGMNALLLVAGYGNDELVDMILDAGADPNTTNDFGHTALHLAVVGKKDQLKKLKMLGSAEAAAADRSLNRRNLDIAIQEWARQNSMGSSKASEEALAKVGNFMMSIGERLELEREIEDDDQEEMKRRVEAVMNYREDKIRKAKKKKVPTATLR